MKIIVNGKEKIVSESLLSYKDIINLSENPYSDYYSVTFSRCSDNRDGILCFKDSVKVKEGTIFNVFWTGNA